MESLRRKKWTESDELFISFNMKFILIYLFTGIGDSGKEVFSFSYFSQ